MWWTLPASSAIEGIRDANKAIVFLRHSDVAFWHIAAFAALKNLGRYWVTADMRALTNLV